MWGSILQFFWTIVWAITCVVGCLHSLLERATILQAMQAHPKIEAKDSDIVLEGCSDMDETTLNLESISEAPCPPMRVRRSPCKVQLLNSDSCRLTMPCQFLRRWTWKTDRTREENILEPYNCLCGISKRQKFYAISIGRYLGIYLTWPESEWLVDGFSGAWQKSFKSVTIAKTWMA